MTFKTLLLSSIFFSALCFANGHTLVNIPEASGIDYCSDTKTLIVANDEGIFYEMTLAGVVLAKHNLGKYDLEGVVCRGDKIVFAVEKGALLVLNRDTLVSKFLKLKGKKFKLSKKAGIEGLTFHNGLYYMSIQAKAKKDAKILVVKAGKNFSKVVDVIEHGVIDTAGLYYREGKLYMVSDKKDKLYIYSLKRNKITKKLKLDKFAQEGITFDEEENVYFADDDGSVKKYTRREVGLRGL